MLLRNASSFLIWIRRFGVRAGLLVVATCALTMQNHAWAENESSERTQLAIGYSLLYQEADGIPKLKWLLAFKEKSSEMSHLVKELLGFYGRLTDRMQTLSKQFPAVRLDEHTMPDIEAEERKELGSDQAKDFAPVVGKSGVDFEREALLMFYDALNEQRHLVGVMMKKETEPALREFLAQTKAQLDDRYSKVGSLLNRKYFTHR
jgi:hypothetical protein